MKVLDHVNTYCDKDLNLFSHIRETLDVVTVTTNVKRLRFAAADGIENRTSDNPDMKLKTYPLGQGAFVIHSLIVDRL